MSNFSPAVTSPSKEATACSSRVRHKSGFPSWPLLVLVAGYFISRPASGLDYDVLLRSADAARAPRYEVFRNFQIRGICGTTRLDMAATNGANTLRTYTPPTREELDQYQRLGLKVIVGIWMPHQGKNGNNWNFDYRTQDDAQLKSFEKTVDLIGNHPALLMWCLGNEVHLDPDYLTTVNRMSLALHKRFPKQLTSLTMINAPEDKIALIKKYAPDLDVIGYNSYGQGSVGGASKHLETVWGRAYYVSEFGPQGPWWGRKSAWGEFYEQSYDVKLDDLRKSFQKIDAAPRCLGSTMFLWGTWTMEKPTYFSAFLSPGGKAKKSDEKELYITPMAEEFCHYWSGKYPSLRAPILTKLSIAGFPGTNDAVIPAGESFKVTAAAVNPDASNPKLHYRWWILTKKSEIVAGPVNTDEPTASLIAPKETGTNYVVMAYVITADGQRASGFTVPIKVDDQKSSKTASNIAGDSAQPEHL